MKLRLPLQRVPGGRHGYLGDVEVYDPAEPPIDTPPLPVVMATTPVKRERKPKRAKP